jgi:O-antigen ligase
VAGSVVLFHTFSRSAWIGALTAAFIAIILLIPRRHRLLTIAGFGLVAAAVASLMAWLIGKGGELQYFLLHSDVQGHGRRGSDFEHIESLRHGSTSVLSNPLGHGLGSAGPAYFHTGEGVIIENNYLQVTYETGLAGGIVFIMIILATARELAARAARHDLALAALAALAGLSIVAIVLPAWTDSSTALIFWTAAGSVIGLKPEGKHV